MKRISIALRNFVLPIFAIATLAMPSLAEQQHYMIAARGTEQLIKLYDPLVRTVASEIPAARGARTECGTVGEENTEAFYCPEERKIFISNQTIESVGNNFGPEGVATLVAHEYAHARQHAAQGFTREIIWTSVVDELQADCVAGVYLRRASPINLTSAMVTRATNFLENIGTYLPLEKDWHGTPEMRKYIFLYGYREGEFAKCLASTDMNLNTILTGPSGKLKRQIEEPDSHLNRLLQLGNDILNNK